MRKGSFLEDPSHGPTFTKGKGMGRGGGGGGGGGGQKRLMNVTAVMKVSS